MGGGKRLAGEQSAIVAAVYGLGNCSPTYDQFVQLYFNLPSVQAAFNFNSTISHIVALRGSPLPDEWIAAAVPNRSEASAWRQWDLKRTARS